LWGIRGWGTWWVWDARLTSVLILFFMYLGYIALWEAIENKSRAAKAAAILAIVGVIMIPIIKFSVEWWNSLHQPASVIRMDGPSIAASMLWPLLVMALAFQFYFAWMLLLRMRHELNSRRAAALRQQIAWREDVDNPAASPLKPEAETA
jgi:heme exporter protein C